jgi:tetratricopeptide (TPR) repeat protein
MNAIAVWSAILLFFFSFLSFAQNPDVAKADELFAQKKYAQAAEAYRILLTRENEYALSSKIGNCYLLLEDFRQAEIYYEKVMRFGQRKTHEVFNYAESLKKNLKIQEAKRWYNEAVLKDPKDKLAKRMANSCQMYLDNSKGGTCSIISSSKNCFTFDATFSVDTAVPDLVYQWEFDSGEKLDGAVVNYCFPGAGKRKIKLNTYSKNQNYSIRTDTALYVNIEGIPITFTSSDSPQINDLINFDASNSLIDGASITDYFWEFGDGKIGLGKIVTHSFLEPGNHVVKLTVTAQSFDGKQDIIYCGYKRLTVASDTNKEKSLLEILREEAAEREKDKKTKPGKNQKK